MVVVIKHRINIIHGHCEYSQVVAAIVSRILFIKAVGTFHRSFIHFYKMSRANLIISKYLDSYIAVSNNRKKLLEHNLLIPKNKLSVNHGGVEFVDNLLTNKKIFLRKKYAISDETLILLSAGHLGELKGHDDTLSALYCVSNKFKDFHLFIAGDGSIEEKNRLIELVEKYHLRNQVTFLGQVRNMNVWYNLCDIIILTPIDEAFGLVFIEAGANAKPVIATNTV